MANGVVKAAAATNTQMDNADLNPDVAAPAATGIKNRRIVHVTLVVENMTLSPDDIYDALDTEFAVVAGEKEMMTRGTWIFNIGPA